MKLGELANKTKEPKKQNPVAKAMTQDPQFKSKVVPDKKKEMKAGYQKHKGKVEEVSSMGMNKYGLAAKNVDGKFYSYKDGVETGVFDSMEELKKHQEHLLQQMDKSHNQESVEESEHSDRAGQIAADSVKGSKFSNRDDLESALSDALPDFPDKDYDRSKAVERAMEILYGDLDDMLEEADGHEASMAKTQMFKTSQIAKQIHDMIERGEDLPGWIQSKLTKASDYVSTVYDYMAYDKMHEDEGDERAIAAMKQARDEEDDIATQKPYVSMYRDDNGKMVYDVLDKYGKSAFKSHDEDEAIDYFSKNYRKMREGGSHKYSSDAQRKAVHAQRNEASGYEGQSEPSSHEFKMKDMKFKHASELDDLLRKAGIRAAAEIKGDTAKIHSYTTDRSVIAKTLGVDENIDPNDDALIEAMVTQNPVKAMHNISMRREPFPVKVGDDTISVSPQMAKDFVDRYFKQSKTIQNRIAKEPVSFQNFLKGKNTDIIEGDWHDQHHSSEWRKKNPIGNNFMNPDDYDSEKPGIHIIAIDPAETHFFKVPANNYDEAFNKYLEGGSSSDPKQNEYYDSTKDYASDHQYWGRIDNNQNDDDDFGESINEAKVEEIAPVAALGLGTVARQLGKKVLPKVAGMKGLNTAANVANVGLNVAKTGAGLATDVVGGVVGGATNAVDKVTTALDKNKPSFGQKTLNQSADNEGQTMDKRLARLAGIDIGEAPGQFSDEASEVEMILKKYPDEHEKLKQGADIMDFQELYQELFSYYMDSGEMPYGVMKARDGDPYQWINDRLDDLGLVEAKLKAGDVLQFEDSGVEATVVDKFGEDIITNLDEKAIELIEAEYQGRKVKLGKPMRGDVKKFKVYVKDPKTGNVKKVNFGHGGTSAKKAGQKTMSIKKSDPARRRSFRARHNCKNPGPRTKARYWSCRAW
jgi:hypothetical protein